MNEIILSTKNTNKRYKRTSVFFGIESTTIGLTALIFAIIMPKNSCDCLLALVFILGIVLVFDGTLGLAIRFYFANSYIDIYEDRIIGKGIQNFSLLNFNIRFENVNNISISSFWIHLHTNSGKYKVITDIKTANLIYNYYNETKN